MTSPLVVLDRRLMAAVDTAGAEALQLAGDQLACRLAPNLSTEAPAFAELARTGADPNLETFVAFVAFVLAD